jgi:hypothetical protein
MAEDDVLRRDLLWRIEARRASIQAYLHERRPRTRRVATITIVLSSLAALFTAGPALGGEPFAQSVQNALGLASDSYVWRTLCFLTLLVSIASAILVNLSKASDDVAKLSSAEAANTELEGLTGLLQFGRLSRLSVSTRRRRAPRVSTPRPHRAGVSTHRPRRPADISPRPAADRPRPG